MPELVTNSGLPKWSHLGQIWMGRCDDRHDDRHDDRYDDCHFYIFCLYRLASKIELVGTNLELASHFWLPKLSHLSNFFGWAV